MPLLCFVALTEAEARAEVEEADGYTWSTENDKIKEKKDTEMAVIVA